jgi:hypothetical protein
MMMEFHYLSQKVAYHYFKQKLNKETSFVEKEYAAAKKVTPFVYQT